jgi:hypothetical protein
MGRALLGEVFCRKGPSPARVVPAGGDTWVGPAQTAGQAAAPDPLCAAIWLPLLPRPRRGRRSQTRYNTAKAAHGAGPPLVRTQVACRSF